MFSLVLTLNKTLCKLSKPSSDMTADKNRGAILWQQLEPDKAAGILCWRFENTMIPRDRGYILYDYRSNQQVSIESWLQLLRFLKLG